MRESQLRETGEAAEAAGRWANSRRRGAVAVVGNYNIDLIMAHVDEFPAWGTEATVAHMDPRTAGAAGYSAMALARLGVSPVCIGNVGDDVYGGQIRNELAAAGAVTEGLITIAGAQTGLGAALIRPDGQRAFVTYTGHLDRLDADLVLAAEAKSPGFAAAQYVLMTGYFLLPALGYAGTRRLFERWKAAGKTILFDTGWDPAGWSAETVVEVKSLLRLVDVFLPNEDEGQALTGEKEPEAAAAALVEAGAGAVVLKLGPRGSLVVVCGEADGKALRAPGVAVAAFDTTGAGDSFNAGVIYGLGKGWPWAETLLFANQLGAIVISRRADRFPTAEEVRRRLSAQSNN